MPTTRRHSGLRARRVEAHAQVEPSRSFDSELLQERLGDQRHRLAVGVVRLGEGAAAHQAESQGVEVGRGDHRVGDVGRAVLLVALPPFDLGVGRARSGELHQRQTVVVAASRRRAPRAGGPPAGRRRRRPARLGIVLLRQTDLHRQEMLGFEARVLVIDALEGADQRPRVSSSARASATSPITSASVASDVHDSRRRVRLP